MGNAATGAQLSLADESAEYREFVGKFKPKKTTDDCYTPDAVYEAVASWVSSEYGVDRAAFVRPFWPGGDYEREDYPQGCVVVDNPPFSILSGIVRFYNGRGVLYFLFAPTLTNFQARGCSHVVCDADVTYANGAVVNTSFVTNLDEWEVRSAPDLNAALKAADAASRGSQAPPRYRYPDNVLTAAMVGKYARRGVDFRVARGDCARIAALDAQRAAGKTIFGSGYLLSGPAAEARAAAEREAAMAAAEAARSGQGGEEVCWGLSERERKLVGMLGGGA